MAAQLVPCSPSVPRSSHRGHRQREAFLGAGQGTRSKLALHGGFPPGAVAGSALMPDTSAQAGWLRSLGEQAESSDPAPAEEGTRWASGKTQAPPSNPSFTDPLSWHTQSACPGRGCCSTAGLSLLPSLFSLSPCAGPSPRYPFVCPGPGQGPGCCLQGQFLLSSLLRTLLQSHSPGARGGNKCQPYLPGAGGRRQLRSSAAEPNSGKKKSKSCVWCEPRGRDVPKSSCIPGWSSLPAMGWPRSPGSYWHVTTERKHNRAQQPERRQHNPHGGASLTGMAAGGLCFGAVSCLGALWRCLWHGRSGDVFDAVSGDRSLAPCCKLGTFPLLESICPIREESSKA